MSTRTKLRLFQHAWKASDLDPDGTCYASEAEADAAEARAAHDLLDDFEPDDLAEAILEHARADEVTDTRIEAIRTGGALTDLEAVLAAEGLRSYDSAVYPVDVEFDTVELLRQIAVPAKSLGSDPVSVAALLETLAALGQQAYDRWEGGNLAGTVQMLSEVADDVKEAFPGLDFSTGDEDEDDDEADEVPTLVEFDRMQVAAVDLMKGDQIIWKEGVDPVALVDVRRISPMTVAITTTENEGTTYNLTGSITCNILRARPTDLD